MSRKPINLDGQRFGMLVVEELTSQRNGYGRLLYRCRCDCGGERLATASNLRRGEITCCGCRYHKPRKDIAGQRFGRLVAVRPIAVPDDLKTTSYRWLCRCDCGRTVEVDVNSLTSGNTTSCGCAQREAVKSLYVSGTAPSKLEESKHPRKTNTSGATGVWYDKSKKLWCAEIMFRRKKYFLGRFREKADAIRAREDAEKELFGTFLDALKSPE